MPDEVGTSETLTPGAFVSSWEHLQEKLWEPLETEVVNNANRLIPLPSIATAQPDPVSAIERLAQLPKVIFGGNGDFIAFGDKPAKPVALTFSDDHNPLTSENLFALNTLEQNPDKNPDKSQKKSSEKSSTHELFGPELSLDLNPLNRKFEMELKSRLGTFGTTAEEQKPASLLSKPIYNHDIYGASFKTPGKDYSLAFSYKFGDSPAPEIPGLPSSSHEAKSLEQRTYLELGLNFPKESSFKLGATTNQFNEITTAFGLDATGPYGNKLKIDFAEQHFMHHSQENDFGFMLSWELKGKKEK